MRYRLRRTLFRLFPRKNKRYRKSRITRTGEPVTDETTDTGLQRTPFSRSARVEALSTKVTEPPSLVKKIPSPSIKKVSGLRRARIAAILIRSADANFDYGAFLWTVRDSIYISELGIELMMKRSLGGGMIMEIPGVDGFAKADVLAKKLQVLAISIDANVRITRPVKKGEIPIRRFDDSVIQAEVASVLATTGYDIDDIQLGPIRKMRNELYMI